MLSCEEKEATLELHLFRLVPPYIFCTNRVVWAACKSMMPGGHGLARGGRGLQECLEHERIQFLPYCGSSRQTLKQQDGVSHP